MKRIICDMCGTDITESTSRHIRLYKARTLSGGEDQILAVKMVGYKWDPGPRDLHPFKADLCDSCMIRIVRDGEPFAENLILE